MAIQGTTRTFTVNLPLDLAEKADAMAEQESRSASEVLGEAFRSFCSQKQDVRDFLLRAGEYADSLSVALTEDDVDRVIHEFRAERPLTHGVNSQS
jgi:predicted transcriptional regulator